MSGDWGPSLRTAATAATGATGAAIGAMGYRLPWETQAPTAPAAASGRSLPPQAKAANTAAVEAWARSSREARESTRESMGRWLYALPRWHDSSYGYTGPSSESWASWEALELAYRRAIAELDGKPLPNVSLEARDETIAEKLERGMRSLADLAAHADKLLIGLAALAVVLVVVRFK